MAGIVILGTQWGDEGKGRMTDYLANRADYVCRFSGGNNAGHTVSHNGQQFLFTILPAGVLQRKKLIIASGVVFDPEILLKEIEVVEKQGIKIDLMIDPRTHIVMPYHRQRDIASEAKKGKKAVGSVGFGIGPCCRGKVGRENLRFEDIIDPSRIINKIDYPYSRAKDELDKIFGVEIKPKTGIIDNLIKQGQKLKKYCGDVSLEISNALVSGKEVLFEGSQGVLLDLNFGTYPYSTGSHIIAGCVFTSVGLAPQYLKTIGVVKSFNSRADSGAGPFPTELSIYDNPGKHILEKGHEYEEFVGIPVRPRRIGWLDLPMLRYATSLNRFSQFALTHIDTLAGLEEVLVCTHYQYEGKNKKDSLPQFPGMTDKVKPIYRKFKGWKEINKSVKKFYDLPKEAQNFIKFIEKETNTPIKYISLGAERKALIEVN